MAYKTNYIDVNKPAKVLSIQISSINNHAQWTENDGQGDRWWSGGASPKYYQWEMTGTVSAQTHGSHLTRKDFEYNGLDVQVGDWIAGATTGQCLKIVSVTAKSNTSVTFIAEDWLRYNTFRAATGNGAFGTGYAVIFQINENGHPMLDPIPLSIVSGDFYQNINSRFQYLNPQLHYVLDQTSHSFASGDVISITGSGFAKTTSASASKTIGTVTNTLGSNQFMLRPNTRIVDTIPAIPGSIGDFVYTDNSTAGGLTTNNASGKIQFLKIAEPIETSVTGDQVDATTTTASVIEVNETAVTLNESSVGAGVTIADAVANINSLTGTHGVTASTVPSPTTCQTSTESLAYGLVGVYPGGQITINGTTVNFTTTTSGQATYGIAVGIGADIVADINSAGPTNITASLSGTDVVLTNSSGGAITIVNVQNDGNGSPVAGAGSGTGFPLTTGASSGVKLKLARADGGEILIDDTTGTPSVSYGVFSVHNGRPPLAIVVDQGIVAGGGGTTVVNDITARNALSATAGDTVYVIDTGNGEYGFYVYSGGAWKLLADEDSANTDANTINITLNQSGGASNTNIGTMSDGARVTLVTVKVTAAFDTTDATLTIGDSGDQDRLMEDDMIDLQSTGTYTSQPGHQYSTGSDQTVTAYFDPGTSTQGTVEVAVTYV